jgi:ACS family hexuronate transporter-like MFS transporter
MFRHYPVISFKPAVGKRSGMGGTAAGVSSPSSTSTATLVAHFGYGVVLTIAGVLAPIGALFSFS